MTDPRGLLYGLLAYVLWGLLPVYWKGLEGVAPLEIVCHRIAWSLVFTGALLAFRGGVGTVLRECRDPRLAAAMGATALLLGLNWLLFIYAVNTDQIVQASLGYFVSPLLNAALGVLVLGERLTRLQSAAIALAAVGVAILTVDAGELPWLALGLAGTFGIYGLGRKMVRLGSLEGLFVESAWLAAPAVAWLAVLGWRGEGAFGTGPLAVTLLLAGAGAITSVPLLLFAASARRLPLTTLGLLQYLSPTLQFLLGILLYGEPFGGVQLAAFGFIWAGLAAYTASILRAR